MRLNGLFALVLAVAPAVVGCGDDIKFPDPPEVPDPALNGLNPPRGFTNRTIDVQISGDGTEFTDAAQVTFGTGININELTLASPSLLIANITITGGATLGAHDVIVTDADNTLTLSQSFEVSDPVEVFTVGAVQQGGFAQVLLVNRDVEHPWIGNIAIDAGNGVNFDLFGAPQVEPFAITALATFDTDAVSGRVVVTDTLGNDVVTSQGNELTVAARTATPLQPVAKSTNQSVTATMNGTTELFSFQENAMVMAEVTTTDLNGQPFMIFLAGGKWVNARGFVTRTFEGLGGADPIPVLTGETMFVVVLDNNAITGYSFDLTLKDNFAGSTWRRLAFSDDLVQVTDTEPNDDDTTAQNGGALDTFVKGTLVDFFDLDFIKVTLTSNQRLRIVMNTGPLGFVDADPFVLDADLDAVFFGNDLDFAEDYRTGVLPAGDYYVVLASSFFGDPINDPYEAAIVVEAP